MTTLSTRKLTQRPPIGHPLVPPLVEGSTETWERMHWGWSRSITFDPITVSGELHEWGSDEEYGDKYLYGTELAENELAVRIRTDIRARMKSGDLPRVRFRVTHNSTSQFSYGINVTFVDACRQDQRTIRFAIDALIAPHRWISRERNHPSQNDISSTNLHCHFWIK